MRSLDPTEDLAIQLVRRFLVLCEHPRTRARMLRIIERAPRVGEEAPRVLGWLNRALLRPRLRRGTRPISAMKWELVASQLLALGTMRYLVRLEPIASADREDVVAVAAPGVLAVLRGLDDFDGLVLAGDLAADVGDDLADVGELDDLPLADEADVDVVTPAGRRTTILSARPWRGGLRAPGAPRRPGGSRRGSER